MMKLVKICIFKEHVNGGLGFRKFFLKFGEGPSLSIFRLPLLVKVLKFSPPPPPK